MNQMATPQGPRAIPLHFGHTSATHGASAVSESAERVKCLIVDQHEPTLTALEYALQSGDRQIFTATTAAEALNLSREHDFAFVLLDVRVPTLDGHALADLSVP